MTNHSATCLFCKIADKENEAKIIAENDRAVAFLDINPAASGHTLIVPRRHSSGIGEMEEEDVLGVFRLVKEVMAKLAEKLAAEGFTIGINHGKIAGQGVDHFHLHIIPRFAGDGGGSLHTIVKNPFKADVSEIYEKIIE